MGERSAQLLAAGGCVWIVVAVLSSGAAPDRETLLGTDRVDLIANIVLLSLWLGLVVFTVLLRAAPERKAFTPPKRPRQWSMLIAVLLVWLFALWRPDFLQNLTPADNETEPPPPPDESVEEVTDAPPPETSGDVTDLLVIIAVAALIGVLVWWRSARGRNTSAAADAGINGGSSDDVEAARGDAAQVLRGLGTTPRDAVLAAYESLETVFRDHDLPRLATETPSEHLQRATSALQVAATPFDELCRLYERARFSTRPITADDVALAAERLETTSAVVRTTT